MGVPTGTWVVFGRRALLYDYFMVMGRLNLHECPYRTNVGDWNGPEFDLLLVTHHVFSPEKHETIVTDVGRSLREL
jgi:hypothetical protein